MTKEIIMKLSIISICLISVMLAATFIISVELLMAPFEAVSIFDFAEQTTGGGRIGFW